MAARLRLATPALEAAGTRLAHASLGMTDDGAARSAGVAESLTGIGVELRDFVLGTQTAQFALADAAHSAYRAVRALVCESDALDTRLAEVLYDGFAVQGMKQ